MEQVLTADEARLLGALKAIPDLDDIDRWGLMNEAHYAGKIAELADWIEDQKPTKANIVMMAFLDMIGELK